MRERLLIVVALLGAVHLPLGIAQEPGAAVATQESDARVDPSEADIKLIRAGSEVFVAAFNKQDAAAVASLWTEDGEYIDDSGRRFSGRKAIEEGYAQFFAEHPDVAIRIAIDSVRLVSPNTAIEEGRAVVEPLPAGAAGIGEYTVVHAKIDGTWFMASVHDTRIEPPAAVRSAVDLEWLVGTWNAEEHGVQMESVCLWVVDGRLLARRYTTTQLDGTAASLASAGAAADAPSDGDWLPLGVFALTKPGQTASDVNIQLAINKQGVIRGNYTDTATNANQVVQGSADMKTQRVALTVGDNTTNIIETGLYNLTKDESPCLLHFGSDRTEQWLLVRLKNPGMAGNQESPEQ